MAEEVRWTIRLLDKTRAGVRSAVRGMRSVGAAAVRAGRRAFRAFRGLGSFIARQARNALLGISALSVLTIKLFADQEAAVKQLGAALTANGDDVDALLPKYQDFASAVQKVTTIGDEAVLSLMAQIRNLGVTTDKLEEATKGALGLSEALGIDMSMAARMSALAVQGNFELLRRYVPALRQTKDATKQAAIVTSLMAKGYEQAQARTKTLAGQFKQFTNNLGDLGEEIGGQIVSGFDLNSMLGRLSDTVRGFIDTLATSTTIKVWAENISEALTYVKGLITDIAKGGELKDAALEEIGTSLTMAFKKGFDAAMDLIIARAPEIGKAIGDGILTAFPALEKLQADAERKIEATNTDAIAKSALNIATHSQAGTLVEAASRAAGIQSAGLTTEQRRSEGLGLAGRTVSDVLQGGSLGGQIGGLGRALSVFVVNSKDMKDEVQES